MLKNMFTHAAAYGKPFHPRLPSMPPPSPPKLSPTSSEGRSMKESIEADEKFDDLYEEIEQAFNVTSLRFHFWKPPILGFGEDL